MGMGGLDTHGGALFCSLTFPSACPGMTVTNNIVAGSVFAGFMTSAANCGDNAQVKFRNNVAHSISGGSNGVGAVIWADPSVPEQKECFEVSHFASYKCTDAGILSNSVSMRIIMHSITSIDVAVGAGAMIGVSSRRENEPHDSIIRDCKFYGESAIPDCPEEGR